MKKKKKKKKKKKNSHAATAKNECEQRTLGTYRRAGTLLLGLFRALL